MPLGKEGLYERGSEGTKERHPPKKRYPTVIGSSNVKMVADRHIHAAHHNKHWR